MNPESSGKMSKLGSCIEEIGLWACLRQIVWFVNWCRRTQPLLSNTILWQSVLNYIEKLAGYKVAWQSASKHHLLQFLCNFFGCELSSFFGRAVGIASRPIFKLLPWVSVLTSLKDGQYPGAVSQISLSSTKLLMIEYLSPQQKWN